MAIDLETQVLQSFGQSAVDIHPLIGGDVSDVSLVTLGDGLRVVAKVDNTRPDRLEIEAFMLRFLAKHSDLPVPEVFSCENGVLFLQYVQGNNSPSNQAQVHAAELLAALHKINGPAYGFDTNTLIGGLDQPNQWNQSWLRFFSTNRLMYMARAAMAARQLPESVLRSVGNLCADLHHWLEEPARPGLIHGDAWGGNILCHKDQIVGFLDPAIYYADPEIELAFTTLFNTFSKPFFDRYHEIRPIKPGFFEERRHIYNLYPLLVHVRLFGQPYIGSVKNILQRFGY